MTSNLFKFQFGQKLREKCPTMPPGVSTSLLSAFLLVILVVIEPSCAKFPENFPPSMTLYPYNFTAWARYKTVHGIWMAFPKTEQDVLDAVNWARKTGHRIRASGFQHNWAPLTVNQDDTKDSQDGTSPIVLLKTYRHLNKMAVISNTTGRSLFWAQTGIRLESMHQILEENNLGFANVPDIGQPTLGGALAIGPHGTSVLREGQTSSPGHSQGTLSNLVISLTAVVFDKKLDKYVLKTFHRSHTDAKYFLTSLGRTFITNVTMRVGPLLRYRVQSFIDIPTSRLLQAPGSTKDVQSFSEMLDHSNGLLVVVFPYTDISWVRQFTLEQGMKPRASRKVTRPYNYPTSATDGSAIRQILQNIASGQPEEALSLGKALAKATNNTLANHDAADIWGTVQNTHMFTQSSAAPLKMSGYALLTSRDRVQKVVSSIYEYYVEVRDEFESAGQYPFVGPMEFRVTGIDDPRDCLLFGVEAPSLSAAAPPPHNSGEDQNEVVSDTVIWTSFKFMANTPGVFQASRRMEYFMNQMKNAGFDRVRPEWAREWAYNVDDGPWHKKAAPQLFESFSRQGDKQNYWADTAKTLQSYDPFGILSSSFLDQLFDQK